MSDASKAISDWLQDHLLRGGDGTPGSLPNLLPLVIVLIVAAAIVVAFFVYGRPQLNRRSAIAGALFGEDDQRDAAALRESARAAAARRDYSTAIAEQFRAIARLPPEQSFAPIELST